MLRVIIARSLRDGVSDAIWQKFETFDFDHPELEAKLAGGFGESGYDLPHIMGIEIRKEVINPHEIILPAPGIIDALRNCVNYWPAGNNDDLQERTHTEAVAALEAAGLEL